MLLTQEEAKEKLGPRGYCQDCSHSRIRIYCRDCDEFFETGHSANCYANSQPRHEGHRHQHQKDNIQKLLFGDET